MKKNRLVLIFLMFATMAFILAGCEDVNILNVAVEGNGSVLEPGEGEFPFEEETVVNLLVEADEGYEFAGWEGADAELVSDVDEDGSYRITVDSDAEIVAVFDKIVTDEETSEDSSEEVLAEEEKAVEEEEVEEVVKEDNSLFSFEKDNYFDVENGSADLSIDDSRAYLGDSSLRIDYEFSNNSEQSNIHFTDYVVEYYPELKNDVYYFNVYVPSESKIPTVQAFIQTNASDYPWYGTAVDLGDDVNYDEWVTIEVDMSEIDDGGDIYKLGLQITAPDRQADFEGSIWLDSITYESYEG